jgi:hypothetical protein
MITILNPLTFILHASYIQDRRTATPQSTLFIYLVNKYISLIFLDFLSPSLFIAPQNVVLFPNVIPSWFKKY